MRTILFGTLVAAGLVVVGASSALAVPANGMVIAPDKLGYQASDAIPIAGGCGPGWHRNWAGRCVPNWRRRWWR